MVYTHVKSFTIVKNRKCGQVTSHCRKARPYRADLSLFLNVPAVTVKSEIIIIIVAIYLLIMYLLSIRS